MRFIELEVKGAFLIEPTVFKDERGFFYESHSEEAFAQHGIHVNFVQDNHSLSRKGILRGLHFQMEPKAQAKLVRVVSGQAFDVIVDIRRNSKTFGQHFSTCLDGKNKKVLYIPKGFAHGFCALENNTELLYKVTDAYSPSHERGIIWNDPTLNISWPKLDVDFILSDRDRKLPVFNELFSLSQ